MANPLQQSKSYVAESLQKLFHKSRDDKYDILAFMMIGEDGSTARRLKVSNDGTLTLGDYALQIAIAGNVYYIGEAAPGSATSGAVWRVRKLDKSSGVDLKWADGNANFDNVWDNYSSLSYS